MGEYVIRFRSAEIRSEFGSSVELELSHLVSQHFGDVRDAGDSLETALPDAPRTHPKNNNIGTISLHSVLHELEVRIATITAQQQSLCRPTVNPATIIGRSYHSCA